MRLQELISEKVNDKLFYQGYSHVKDILGGEYTLTASAGYVGYGSKPGYKSQQFRIVAKTKSGVEIGWVNFENKDDKLEALDLSIQPEHRRKGIASEMYKFAKELGNDISPSKMQASMGKQFWSKKDHNKPLNETAEEDRAIISLASAIYDYVCKFSLDEDHPRMYLGKIGEIFDTPLSILNNIGIEIMDDEQMEIELPDKENSANNTKHGFWDPNLKYIGLNMLDVANLKTTITHELRHALDDYKSYFNASVDDNTYSTPRKKQHVNSKVGNVAYHAQPKEINARFLQVLEVMSRRVPYVYSRFPEEEIKSQLLNDFKHLLVKYNIAYLFPEKEKSTDYKRLIKRGYDFIQKEMNHIEQVLSTTATPKAAIGNW